MIYRNIKAIADKKGMAIRTVEEKAHLGNGVIGKWRKSYPRIVTLIAVADALEVPVMELLKGLNEGRT